MFEVTYGSYVNEQKWVEKTCKQVEMTDKW